MKYRPHDYQRYAQMRIEAQQNIGLFLEMGLGKTVITLSAIADLMRDLMVGRVLIIAPLRVAQTVWDAEAAKWDHTRHLKVVKCVGSQKERMAALRQESDIVVINRENVEWLVRYVGLDWPFDCVVIDELSSFKNRSSGRFKALRRVRSRISRVIGLTGTPTPNGLIDLWAQMFLIDGGEALGQTLTGYRDRYFTPGRRNGMVVYEWRLKIGAEDEIYRRIAGSVVSMKSVDFLTMPPRVDNAIEVDIGEAGMAAYRKLEKDLVLQLGDSEITAASAAALCNKLQQAAGGAVFDENGEVVQIHQAKVNALLEAIEASCGHPVLVYYAYTHEAQRIMDAIPSARLLRGPGDVADWNAGKIPVLLAHPDSAGHGLNLQAGGHIMIWFGLTWSLEKYQQANARLHRQGQQHACILHHIVAKGTVDERIMQVLAGKAERQDALIEAVKARRDEICASGT